jgi:Uma2 family endonuclease
MTVAQPPTNYSTDELLRFQSEAGVEFVNGLIVEKPVSIESSRIELAIGSLMRAEALKTHEAEVFGPSMGYQCFPEDPARYRKPDVSVVRSKRLEGFDPRAYSRPAGPCGRGDLAQ